MNPRPAADSDRSRSFLPKREAILDAATAVFCREGFSGASIDAVACEAQVSRQTIYNQIGDKEKLFRAVIEDITERSSAGFFALLETFPDAPADLEKELTQFSVKLLDRYGCDANGKALRKLIQAEGERYPELFQTFKDYGPGRKYPAIAARLAQLAHGGYLEIEDSGVAARQFMALLFADLRNEMNPDKRPAPADMQRMASCAVRTFLRAYGTEKHRPR